MINEHTMKVLYILTGKGNCIISQSQHFRFFCKPHTGSRYCHITLVTQRSMRTQEICPVDSDIYDF